MSGGFGPPFPPTFFIFHGKVFYYNGFLADSMHGISALLKILLLANFSENGRPQSPFQSNINQFLNPINPV